MSATSMERLNTALSGRYRIESELGEGGMATVYLADDIKHERKVALKVLKPELAAVVGAERFLAEIKTTANLRHPHILPLFDSGEADSFVFYVMPHVEGESLRERIDREKQLPVDEAVRIATAVANALQHAHERGVIHRDIKPANILIQDGEPLVADFGIALAVGTAGSGRLTETGLSVGTPYYMSPEQATGDHAVGAASDMYSLACVLYEMLVGEPPHAGSTAQAVLSKIIAGDLTSPVHRRPTVPQNVDAAIRRGLELLPADRFASVQTFATALSDSAFRHGEVAQAASAPNTRTWKALALSGWGAAFAALAVMASGLRQPQPFQVVRSQVPVAAGQESGWTGGINIALSDDGTSLVYVGETHLWHRRLDQLETVPINGTDWARNPVISPDGSTLAFVARGSLRTVSLQGGPLTVVVSDGVRDAQGGFDWSSNDVLYFVDLGGVVHSVAAGGGESVELAVPEAGQLYAWIDALPDGRGLLLTIVAGSPDQSRIAVFDSESGSVRPLFPGTTARYVSPGYIVYAAADSSLSAVPFDLDRLETTGPPTVLPDKVEVHPGSASQFAVSQTGSLAYVVGNSPTVASVVRVDRAGNAQEIDPSWRFVTTSDYGSLALSPSGDRLAVAYLTGGSVDMWVKPLNAEPARRVTTEGTINFLPAWSPDGTSLAFVSDRGGQYDAWTTRPDGVGEPVPLLDRAAQIAVMAYSPDNEWLIYGAIDGTDLDIYAHRLRGSDEDIVLAATEFREIGPVLSPDGRWLAYSSDISGNFEVYVVSFPDPLATDQTLASIGGGTEPVWAHNGRELFYLNGNKEIVVVEFEGDDSFVVEGRQVLFTLENYLTGPGHALYAVSPDDQSFFMFRRIPPESRAGLMLVQNFLEQLKATVGN